MKKKINITGARIWISGAIPELEHWPHPLYDRDVLSFVSLFSSLAFKNGGTIIHGSHPSFTPLLVHQLKKDKEFRKNQLVLFVSTFFGHETFNKYNEDCIVFETKKLEDLTASLSEMRKELALSANVMLVLGGKQHVGKGFKPGIIEEVEIGLALGMKVYVLPHFYGAAKKYLKSNRMLEVISDQVDLSVLAHQILNKIHNDINPSLFSRLLRLLKEGRLK